MYLGEIIMSNPRENSLLFKEVEMGSIKLKNRLVMSPMTRSRSINNIPSDLVAQYYEQRAGAGLIITEGTSPSPNGLGYPRIPGVYSDEQKAGWKKVADAVHKHGSKIFVQFMHTGRVSHPDNLPKGAKHIAPSAIGITGEMWTDANGLQKYPVPEEMSAKDIEDTKKEFVHSAKVAMEAGLDGVELHAANGYLLEQFLNPISNTRTDSYGGNSENRNRFVLEVVKEVANAIGKEKVGIRISPYGVFNDIQPFDGIEDQYEALVKALNETGIAYVHLVNHESTGAPKVPESMIHKIRNAFKHTFILSGGFDFEKADKSITSKEGELVAFARPFLANPDLVERLKHNHALNNPDFDTFYTPGEKGYTDYPNHKG
jgi:N-ethylmaleimide reductase